MSAVQGVDITTGGKMTSSITRARFALLCATAIVSGCGGGGGGSSEPTVQVTTDKPSLELAVVNDQTGGADITFTLQTAASGQFYGVASSDGMSFDVSQTASTSNSATYHFSLHTPATTPGDHKGTLTVKLCHEATCTTSPLWTGTLPYTVHAFSVPTDTVTIVASAAGGPVSASIPITPPDTGHLLTFFATYDENLGKWLHVSHDAAASITVTVTPDVGQPGSSGYIQGAAQPILVDWQSPAQ